MKNVSVEMQGKVLVVKIDTTQNFGKSKSGKTTIVASTGGNVSVPGGPEGLKLGINAYIDG